MFFCNTDLRLPHRVANPGFPIADCVLQRAGIYGLMPTCDERPQEKVL